MLTSLHLHSFIYLIRAMTQKHSRQTTISFSVTQSHISSVSFNQSSLICFDTWIVCWDVIYYKWAKIYHASYYFFFSQHSLSTIARRLINFYSIYHHLWYCVVVVVYYLESETNYLLTYMKINTYCLWYETKITNSHIIKGK